MANLLTMWPPLKRYMLDLTSRKRNILNEITFIVNQLYANKTNLLSSPSPPMA